MRREGRRGKTMRKTIWSPTRRGVLGTALALAAALPAAAQEEREAITIGALRFTSHAPTFIAYERGYFAEEGFDAELSFFQAAQPIAVAIASGDVDFGITALTGGFFNLADRGALKVIGGLYTEDPAYPGMAILASNDAFEAGLTSPAGLAGHSWAMTQQGSSFHYVAGMIAEEEGFALGDLTLRPLQQVPAMINAVKSGQVDAMAMVPHVAVPLDSAGAAKIIGWVRDLGDYQVTTIFTSTEKRRGAARDGRGVSCAPIAAASRTTPRRCSTPRPTPRRPRPWSRSWRATSTPTARSRRPRPRSAPAPSTWSPTPAIDMEDLGRQLAWAQENGLAPEGLTVEGGMVSTEFSDVAE